MSLLVIRTCLSLLILLRHGFFAKIVGLHGDYYCPLVQSRRSRKIHNVSDYLAHWRANRRAVTHDRPASHNRQFNEQQTTLSTPTNSTANLRYLLVAPRNGDMLVSSTDGASFVGLLIPPKSPPLSYVEVGAWRGVWVGANTSLVVNPATAKGKCLPPDHDFCNHNGRHLVKSQWYLQRSTGQIRHHDDGCNTSTAASSPRTTISGVTDKVTTQSVSTTTDASSTFSDTRDPATGNGPANTNTTSTRMNITTIIAAPTKVSGTRDQDQGTHNKNISATAADMEENITSTLASIPMTTLVPSCCAENSTAGFVVLPQTMINATMWLVMGVVAFLLIVGAVVVTRTVIGVVARLSKASDNIVPVSQKPILTWSKYAPELSSVFAGEWRAPFQRDQLSPYVFGPGLSPSILGTLQWTEMDNVEGVYEADVPAALPFYARMQQLLLDGGNKLTRIVMVVNLQQHQAANNVASVNATLRASGSMNNCLDHNQTKQHCLQLLKNEFERGRPPNHSRGTINTLPVFHGCAGGERAATAICHNAAADLRRTDGGYFGAGIYVTSQPSYAAMYSKYYQPDYPCREKVMLFAKAIVSMTYPITRQDDYGDHPNATHAVSRFHFQYPLEYNSATHSYTEPPNDNNRVDKAIKSGYDSHFVVIRKKAKFHAVNDPTEYDLYELVLKEPRQILPVCRVYFQGMNTNADASDSEDEGDIGAMQMEA